MAGEREDLKLRLALEYDDAGLAAFAADVESALSAARGASSGLSGLAGGITSVTAAAATGADDLSASLLDAARAGQELAPISNVLDDTADSMSAVTAAADDASAGLSSVETAATGAGDGGARAAAGLGQLSDRSVKAAGAITAIALALGVATAAASEYQQSITLISTLSSETAARFDEYKAGILDVSQALGQDAVAAARAAYDALSSGVSADAAISFLESASKAATAGVTSVDVAGKALTVTLNSFNLKASETTNVSDAMFAAANVGVTTFDELAASFGGVAGIAASSGASYQETLGALAQITTKGKSTSEAVTQLKATFTALAKPNALVAEALQKQGFASADAAIKAKGLQHVLETVRQVSVDTGQPLINLVGSVEAVSAVLDTTGANAEASRQKMDALGASAGATQAAFDLISETPAQRMAVFQSSVQAAVITLGDAFLPVLGAILDAVTPLVQGITSLVQTAVVPLGEAFAGLPEPIRLVTGLLAALVIGGAGVVTAYASGSAVMGLFTTATAGSAVSAGVAAGAMGTLQTAASSAFATIAAAALPITAIVAVLGTLAFASQAANDSLEEQLGALDQASAGWDDYAQAAARARDGAGLLATIGFDVNDSLSAASDQNAIFFDNISSAWARLTAGSGEAAKTTDETTGRLKVSAQAAIDAGEAYLSMGTNIDAAVLESDAFNLAQARLNEQLRAGKLSTDDYQKALIATADAISKSQGAGAVLDRQQQAVKASFEGSLTAIASSSGALSDAVLASEELAAKHDELATAVAQGGTSADTARAAFAQYVDQLAAGDTEAQATISANAALDAGYRELVARLDAGTISFADATAKIQELGLAANASEGQMSAMSAAVAAAAQSPELASFGVTLDTETIGDPEKLVKAVTDAQAAGNQERMKLFSEILQAEGDYYADRAGLVSDNEGRLAKAGEEGAKQVAEARAKGDAESIVKAEEAAAKRVETVRTENAARLTELDNGYAAEQAKRREAIAQASLDQVNAMLRLGQISEQQAQIIFGSLKDAFPGAELFDPAAEAALEYNATFGRAMQGSVVDAVQLGEKIQEIPTSLDAAEAKADEYSAKSVAAYQAARAEVGLLTDAQTEHSAAAATSGDGATAAADVEADAAARRIASSQSLADEEEIATGRRVAARETDAESSLTAADSVIADHGRTTNSVVEAAGIVDVQYGKMGSAQDAAAGSSKSATDAMVGDAGRLQGATTRDLTDAEIRVRRFGGAFPAAAADVRVGAQGIVNETGRANQALGGLGTDIPSRLAPATEAVGLLGKSVATLGEDVVGAADKRSSAEEGAGKAAQSAAQDTTSGLSDIAGASEEAEAAIQALREALEGLPARLQIPILLVGADKVKAAIAGLVKDLKAISTAATIRIYGTYIPLNPAMKPDESLRLQHDVEDALAAAEPGLNIYGAYEASGAMSWTSGGLALQSAIQAAFDQTNAPLVLQAQLDADDAFMRLLFNADSEGEFLAKTLRSLAELQAAIDRAAAAAKRAEAVIPQALAGIASATAGFFTTDPNAGGLAALIAQFDRLAEQAKDPSLAAFGRDFFQSAGILDASSFDDFRAQLALLANEPERQEELWGAFIDALENRWKVYYERESNNLERQKRVIQANIDAAKAAGGEDADTSALELQLDGVDRQLRSLKDQNEDINLTLKEQTFSVQAQFDLYGRLSDAAKDRAKVEADAQRALDEALKKAQDEVKGRQKASEDAEKTAHEQAMDLLDDEVKRRERQHKQAMKNLEGRRDREEANIKARAAAEEKAHAANLAAITAEVDAEQKRLDIEDERIKLANEEIDRAKNLIETIEKGNAITDEQVAFLRSMGIDPDQIVKVNTGLKSTKTEIDDLTEKVADLKGLFDKLPDEIGRVQLAGSQLAREFGRTDTKRKIADISGAEKQRLQDLLGSAGLSKSDRRIIEVFLAGGVVQARRLREILGPTISADEQTIKDKQALVDLAEKEVDLAGQLLEKRAADLKVAEDDLAIAQRANDAARAALQAQIDAEKKRHEDVKAHANDRLNAIDAEKRAVQDQFNTWKEAISDAKEAEADRHDARMKQLQEEYALELLRLGLSEADVQKKLIEQAERAAAIATEAQRRFRAMLDEANTPPEAPALPRLPRLSEPAPVPGADPNRQTKGGRLTPPGQGGPPPEPLPGIEPPEPPPLPFILDPDPALLTIQDVFGEVDNSIAHMVADAQGQGVDFARAAFGPSIDALGEMRSMAMDLTGIMPPMSTHDMAMASAGTVNVDRRVVFNGPVYLDRDLAEDLGIIDAARTGAP